MLRPYRNAREGVPLVGWRLITATAVVVMTVLGPPVAWGESAPSTTAVLTVTPARGLHDGETVTVALRGFPDGAKVYLSQCATAAEVNKLGCGDQLAAQPFIVTDPSGVGIRTFVVYAAASTHPYSPNQQQPCAAECVIMATGGSATGEVVAFAPISFALPFTGLPAKFLALTGLVLLIGGACLIRESLAGRRHRN